jgi:hypothetical protein
MLFKKSIDFIKISAKHITKLNEHHKKQSYFSNVENINNKEKNLDMRRIDFTASKTFRYYKRSV